MRYCLDSFIGEKLAMKDIGLQVEIFLCGVLNTQHAFRLVSLS